MAADTLYHVFTHSSSFRTVLPCTVLLLRLPEPSFGAIQGHCDNCHTMHNSQNNQPMNYLNDFDTPGRPNDYCLPFDQRLRRLPSNRH